MPRKFHFLCSRTYMSRRAGFDRDRCVDVMSCELYFLSLCQLSAVCVQPTVLIQCTECVGYACCVHVQ